MHLRTLFAYSLICGAVVSSHSKPPTPTEVSRSPSALEKISGNASSPSPHEAVLEYCYLTNIPGTWPGSCDSTQCLTTGDSTQRGQCYLNDKESGGSGRCNSKFLGPRNWRVAACSTCKCVGSQNRGGKPPNRYSSWDYHGNNVNGFRSRSISDTGEATISQYLEWHSEDDYANPLADWSENGDFSFGEKDGIYKRSPHTKTTLANGMTRYQTIEPKVVVDGNEPHQTNNLSLILSQGEYVIDADGSPANFGVTYVVQGTNNATKRDDWSQINFQYWSSEGSRITDVDWYAMQRLYVGILDVQRDGVSTGFCAAVIDDGTFWATIKVWKGNQGYSLLGDCECSSSDYPEIEGPACGEPSD